MIASRLELNRPSIERTLVHICDTVATGETPLTTYSSIAGRDADVSIEHDYRPPADDETPPLVETTVYVDESFFSSDAALTPEQYGVAPESVSLAADPPADEPTRLSELGPHGRTVVDTLADVATSVAGIEAFVPAGEEGFDAVCVSIYPNPPATAAFLAQFAVDEAIVYRPEERRERPGADRGSAPTPDRPGTR